MIKWIPIGEPPKHENWVWALQKDNHFVIRAMYDRKSRRWLRCQSYYTIDTSNFTHWCERSDLNLPEVSE